MEEKEVQKEKKEEKAEIIEDEDAIQRKNFEKYRIDYLSFKTSQPITSLKAVCPLCSKIPNINLSRNSERGHYVKCVFLPCRYCYCCSHPRSKTLEDYISIMAKIQQDNVNCDIHKEKGEEVEAFFSCEKCQKWMCEKCINDHIQKEENKNHYYYILRKVIKGINSNTICPKHNLEYTYYVSEDFAYGFNICNKCKYDPNDPDLDITYINKDKGQYYFNELKLILKKGVEYLDVYCNNIYENLIKSIKNNPDLIKKAKDIYDKFIIRNRRALFYFQMLINTGTPSISNYNLINNISNAILTKFERLNINLSDKLSEKEINEILNFFENNYIVGTYEENLEKVKNLINIKELSTIKIDSNNEQEKKEKAGEKKENNKIIIVDIIRLNDNMIIVGDEKGDVHLFELDKSKSNGKFILSKKAHEKTLISLDNIKNTKNKFVTCDENEIRIWGLKQNDNKYNIECETKLNDLSESEITYLYVLNHSNCISFINQENQVIILNMIFKPFFKVHFETESLNTLYQIDSDDENDGIFIIGGKGNIIMYKNLDDIKNIKCLGSLRIDSFSGKSIHYFGDNIVLVGGIDNIYMVDIKDVNLKQIIRISSAECTCFLKFKDMIICGYGDTSGCSFWSNGIAGSKDTKFIIIKKNEENYEYHYIEDEFYNYGIINALLIDNNKFISCFYNNDCLKIFQLK